MRVLDSRRLTGPSLLLDAPGAILEVALDGADPRHAMVAWERALEPLLAALGWDGTRVAARAHAAGLSLAFSAPADVLYAATEVNEAAWRAAAEQLAAREGDAERAATSPFSDAGAARAHGDAGGGPGASPDSALAEVRAAVGRERKPWLDMIAREAAARGLTLLADDKRVSVGLGSGSRAWPAAETPELLGRIPWSDLSDIPVALVTGTNGKTTTVRLLAAIARADGLVAGATSTDHVTVGDDVVAEGDYSGPNGARTVLRDRRVQIAMLEVARGGILRRGLALPRVNAALVTNVANDHLGEFGIFDLESLADVKMVVAKAVGPDGRVVLNADDPRLLDRGRRLAVPVTWFTLDARHPALAGHLAGGGEACVLDGETLVLLAGGERRAIAAVSDVPIAFGGAARHNVANALAAIGVATALGLSEAAIRAGLLGFDTGARTNPGRANVWRLGGATAIVDFAHNPHGLAALAHMIAAMPARRRAIVIGQAGDRDDEAIREFARAAWAMGPAAVFIKEMDVYRRGREPGVIPALIEAELRGAGAGPGAISHWPTELAAVHAALTWAREGDLLLLTTHAQRDDVIALLTQLAESGWVPGQPVPHPIAAV